MQFKFDKNISIHEFPLPAGASCRPIVMALIDEINVLFGLYFSSACALALDLKNMKECVTGE
jgi:hypothetical protein